MGVVLTSVWLLFGFCAACTAASRVLFVSVGLVAAALCILCIGCAMRASSVMLRDFAVRLSKKSVVVGVVTKTERKSHVQTPLSS